MTGLTRQQAAKAVADLFGTSARRTFESAIYDPWEVIDREGKKWRFVFDSSIKATKRIHGHQVPVDIDLYKVEMNSPKLEYSEMGKLQEVVRALRHAGAVVNGWVWYTSMPPGQFIGLMAKSVSSMTVVYMLFL